MNAQRASLPKSPAVGSPTDELVSPPVPRDVLDSPIDPAVDELYSDSDHKDDQLLMNDLRATLGNCEHGSSFIIDDVGAGSTRSDRWL